MYQFKFKDDNINESYGKTSHILQGTKIKQLTKFVTFDTESTCKFFDEKNEIDRKIYEEISSDDKYKMFFIKTIQATFVYDSKIKKNILYINGDSIYNKKSIEFTIKKFNNDYNIKAKIKYFENENDMLNQFWNDIEKFNSRKKQELKIFCHNSKHDWVQTKVFDLHNRSWELKNFRFSIPRFCVWNLKDKKKIVMLDTVNYFKQKLETLGEEIGIKKMKENVDFRKEIKVDEKFLHYGIVDSIILAEKLIEFNNLTKKLGTIGYGIASTSYNIWRTSFMTEKIWLHKNICLSRIERLSYFGGRTESFKLGFYKNVHGIDINSQYPYQMLKALPVRYIKSLRAFNEKEQEILKRKFLELKDKYLMVCEVEVKSTLKIPIVPLKYKGKLMFVKGKINTVLAQPEIELCLQMGEDVIFKGIHIYKKGYPFKKFAQEFYNSKQENKKLGNLSLEQFYKIILNACYGKTSEREIEEIQKNCDKNFIGKIIEVINNKEYHFNCLSGIMKASKFLNNDSKNAFCVIGSFITSYARSYLYEGIYKIGFENVLYCDTDSIYTNLPISEIKKRLEINDYKLGSWSFDYKNVDMLIFGVKDYIISKDGKKIKQKLKGINLRDSYEINENEWICEKWSTLSYGIKLKDLGHQYIYNQKKILSKEYTKAKLINSEEKNIYIDGKNINYIKSDLEHFDIKELL